LTLIKSNISFGLLVASEFIEITTVSIIPNVRFSKKERIDFEAPFLTLAVEERIWSSVSRSVLKPVLYSPSDIGYIDGFSSSWSIRERVFLKVFLAGNLSFQNLLISRPVIADELFRASEHMIFRAFHKRVTHVDAYKYRKIFIYEEI